MFELTKNLLFSVHGGGDGGVAGLLEDLLATINSLLDLPANALFGALLPGISVMLNIHPLFVHFPIALLSTFFLLDVLGSLLSKPVWRGVAGWFLFLGSVFAGLTVLAGLFAAATVPHGEDVHAIMENHEHLGVSVFGLAIFLSGWRLFVGQANGVANYLFLSFAALLWVLLVFTADLGGLMVYRYGVAVTAAEAGQDKAFIEHQHQHSN